MSFSGKGGWAHSNPKNFAADFSISRKKSAILFSETRGGGGGVKGRFEFFRKFIQI